MDLRTIFFAFMSYSFALNFAVYVFATGSGLDLSSFPVETGSDSHHNWGSAGLALEQFPVARNSEGDHDSAYDSQHYSGGRGSFNSQEIPRKFKPELLDGDMMGLNSSYIGVYIQASNSAFSHSQRGTGLMLGGVRDTHKLWPNATIPVMFGEDYTDRQKRQILSAWSEIQNSTCVRFKGRTNESNYILVTRPHHRRDEGFCGSYVGVQGKRQNLTLDWNCFHHRTLLHESMHVLGFFHEHQRPDRDRYIKINKRNIRLDYDNQFKKIDIGKLTTLKLPYDFRSVTHYAHDQFSNNGGSTIITVDPRNSIEQISHLSELDIERINRLYNCPQANWWKFPFLITPTPPSTTTNSPVIPTLPTTEIRNKMTTEDRNTDFPRLTIQGVPDFSQGHPKAPRNSGGKMRPHPAFQGSFGLSPKVPQTGDQVRPHPAGQFGNMNGQQGQNFGVQETPTDFSQSLPDTTRNARSRSAGEGHREPIQYSGEGEPSNGPDPTSDQPEV